SRRFTMKVWFGQFYIEAGAVFPFSHHFQRRLSHEITALVQPSPKFTETYGADFEVMFRISAKHDLDDNEVRGPTVFKKKKDIEYTVFLPFDKIMNHADAPRHVLVFLFRGVYDVFDKLEIDKTNLLEAEQSLIGAICSDPAMLAEPSWNETEN